MDKTALWLRRRVRRGFFATVRMLARIAGFRHAPTLGKIVGELEYWLAWRRRRHCAHDMALALGRPVGDPWIEVQLRRAHHVNAQALLEILAMLDRREDAGMLATRAQIEGTEHLRAALAAGHGAILLGAHAGNGVLFAVLLAAAGWPVSVVCKQARMMPADFFARGFALYGLDGILANEGLRAYGRMLDAVKRGRIVFVTLDQGVKAGSNGIVVRFLGKDVVMAAGPAQLARRSQAPVLPVIADVADGTWRFRIDPALPPADGPLALEVERMARASERQALLHPDLWSWHHRRWHRLPFAHAKMAAEPVVERDPRPRHHAP